jgi:kynureninase
MPDWTALAADLDAADPLASFREEFVIDEAELCYLDGNSLGRLPKRTIPRVEAALRQQWGGRLIRGWNDGWLELPVRLASMLAKILNVKASEVLVGDTTSLNLYKLALGALRAHERTEILTTTDNFPSDLYILQGLGSDLRVVEPDRLESTISNKTAIVTASHVAYGSGQRGDIAHLSAVARSHGAWSLWDLSHSAGVVPLDLSTSDMAVGCGYKYLNGGPGAPAFLYLRSDLQETVLNPIQGWFGQDRPFSFEPEYQPVAGISKFQVSTPSVLSMVALESGLELYLEAGAELIWQKAVSLTAFFIDMVCSEMPGQFEVVTPLDPAERGAHVSLRHPDAWRITRALTERMNVIPDFRRPDMVRFGFSPLTTSFAEVSVAVHRLAEVMRNGIYTDISDEMPTVT